MTSHKYQVRSCSNLHRFCPEGPLVQKYAGEWTKGEGNYKIFTEYPQIRSKLVVATGIMKAIWYCTNSTVVKGLDLVVDVSAPLLFVANAR